MKKTWQFTTSYKGRLQQNRRTKTANITKDGITSQHVAEMSLCCELISSCVLASAYQISSKSDHPWQSNVMTSYPFSRWQHRNSTSGFGFLDFAHLGRSPYTCISNFGRQDISIHGWDITTSGFWKQTSSKLEFYFRSRFLRLRHHRHVILHLPIKCRPNRIIRDRVMTSYLFFKMAATA